MNKIIIFLKLILRIKFIFKTPEKCDLIVFDDTSVHDLNICLSKFNFFVLQTRIDSREDLVGFKNIPIYKIYFSYKILKQILKNFSKGNLFTAYLVSLIELINPKVVITTIDISLKFSEVAKILEKKINFIAIQNVLVQDFLEWDYLYKTKKIKHNLNKKFYIPNLFCMGDYDREIWKQYDINVKNFYPIGNLRLANFFYHIKSENNSSGGDKLKSKGQKELDEYIFTRKEMATLLGISPNALRHRMRRGGEGLDYRFDGTKFLFKRAGAIKVRGHPLDTPKTSQTSHEKTLRDYDRKVQQRYNRGSTHLEHGGKPSHKGKYTQQSFKHHNELKIMNSLQGKYQNDAQRREFENMNEEALKEANKRAKAKAVFEVPDNPRPGRLRGRLNGEQPHYGNMLNATGLQRIQDNEDKNSLLDFERDTAYSQKREGHSYYKPFASTDNSFYLNPAYDPANINNEDPNGGVEFDNNYLENSGPIQERRSDSFGSKVEESIYRAKKDLLKKFGSWD